MIDKKALNPVKERGFQSKSQMRYLLMMAKKYPGEYSWVLDAFKRHGTPGEEGPLQTYWTGPYNKSPDTPSYVYTGRGRKAMLEKLIKIAQKFDDSGNPETAKKLDKVVVRKMMVDENAAKLAANAFWVLRKNEVPKDPEGLALFLDQKFSEFKPFQMLPNSETKEEAKRMVADKILGRG